MSNKKIVLVIMLVCLLMVGDDVVFASCVENNVSAPLEIPPVGAIVYKKVIIDGARLRKQANTQSTVLGLMYKGEEVELIQYNTEKTWAKVKRDDGTEGWVLSKYLK